jgi:hypothetical protein
MYRERWRMQTPLLASLVLAITLSLLAGGEAARNQTADFGFRFEYGLCTSEVFDTFKAIFIREMKPEPELAIPLTLEGGSLTDIRRAVADARFFEYPSEFRPGVRDAPRSPLDTASDRSARERCSP